MSNRIYVRNESESNKRNKKKIVLFLFVLMAIALVVVIKISGDWLIHQDKITGYRWGFVLDGQSREMDRTNASAELLEQGIIDSVVISGARNYRKFYNSQFYALDLIEQKVDPQRLIELRHDANSTFEEAMLSIPYFRELEADTVLLITSNYHTRRAGKIFNFLAEGDPVFVTYAVEDPLFHPENWVFEKEAAAIWLVEVLKHIQTQFELWQNRGITLPNPIWNNWVRVADSSSSGLSQFQSLINKTEFNGSLNEEPELNAMDSLFSKDSLNNANENHLTGGSSDSLIWKDSLQ